MGQFSEELDRAKAGDPEALCWLLDRYGGHLSGILRTRLNATLRRRYDTIDLRQSVILEVLRELARFEDRGERAFRGWLAIKARNKVRTKFRKLLRPTGAIREESWNEDFHRPESRDSSPVEAVLRDENNRDVRTAIGDLEPRHREVLLLRGEEGLSHAEVAEWMALPTPEAARKLYARALVKLRVRLKTA